MTRLTPTEIDTLIDALDVWEAEPMNAAGANTLVFALMASDPGDTPERKRELEHEIRARESRAAETARGRRRLASRLKARLYDLRDEAGDGGADDAAAPITPGGDSAPGG